MASVDTLCKKLLGVKSAIVTGHDFYQDSNGLNHLRIHARPSKRHENDCPFCHRHCRFYDIQTHSPRIWRSLDWGGTLVEIQYRTHRIECPEHGVLVADVPWTYPGSGFTKDFDLTAGWLAVYLPRSTVSEYMRIDWETVGRCVHRTLDVIEPERARRLDNLVNIGIDETSYRKGQKYITVIVNHDTNTVVWATQGHGKKVLEQFYRQLTPKQLSAYVWLRGTEPDGLLAALMSSRLNVNVALILSMSLNGRWKLWMKFAGKHGVKLMPKPYRQKKPTQEGKADRKPTILKLRALLMPKPKQNRSKNRPSLWGKLRNT